MKRYTIKIILVVFISSCVSQKKDVQTLVDSANKDLREDRLRKAYRKYYEAAKLSRNPEYYVWAAYAYYLGYDVSKNRHADRTRELFNESFNISPWNTFALQERSKYYHYQGRNEDCIRDIDSLLKRDKANLEAYLLKASIYMAWRDTVRAFKVYDEGLSQVTKSRDKRELLLGRAFNASYKGLWKEAKSSYLRALSIADTSYFRGYCSLGLAYYNLGMKDSACYYLENCAKEKTLANWNQKKLMSICK